MIPIVSVGPKLTAFLRLVLSAGKVPLLIGPTGIGKTETILALAREMKLPCIVLNLSTLEPVDLTGLPQIRNGITEYAPPSILSQAGCGILFLDEINRVAQLMLNPLLQLITLRRLNRYVLPAGWLIVAAANPQDDDGYQVEELDLALVSRFVRVRVEPDAQAWAEWARAQATENPNLALHSSVLAFVENSPKVFDGKLSNPRAWTWISDLIKRAMASGEDLQTLHLAVQGIVGAQLAQAFRRVLRDGAAALPPTPQEVLKSYGKVRARVQALTKSGDHATINSLCSQILVLLQDPDRELEAQKNRRMRKNLENFRSDLPAEFRIKLERRLPWLIGKKGNTL